MTYTLPEPDCCVRCGLLSYSAAQMHAVRAEGQQESAARIAELERDAARYRWLRKQAIDGEPGVPVIAVPNGFKSGYYLSEETADYALDAAMKEQP